MEPRSVTVTINGQKHTADVEPRMHLGDFLRTVARQTGTHLGCEHGVCGACTVIVDGDAVRSCLMLAVQANGKDVTTIEGLAQGTELHPVQQAFRDHHGLQCGFCTPGMIISLTAYLTKYPHADEAEIRKAISGNICRCTGYQGIVAAGVQAAKVMREEA